MPANQVYLNIENMVFKARSEIIGFVGISPTRNPGVRIQNKVFTFGAVKKY